ncbi:uncharacterized protein LOC110854615 [Folsomia candida]|uniref:Uncharacterized protein n=1 Tax=Folsomia candida TaxID=158441 RepID=A0A226DWS2_FOLCA|nr:uncharacterized protein LOC110854615 [Folsomia candida]OXA49167.1 hypothetical protein Fcan01_15626 [Folsomia candida]
MRLVLAFHHFVALAFFIVSLNFHVTQAQSIRLYTISNNETNQCLTHSVVQNLEPSVSLKPCTTTTSSGTLTASNNQRWIFTRASNSYSILIQAFNTNPPLCLETKPDTDQILITDCEEIWQPGHFWTRKCDFDTSRCYFKSVSGQCLQERKRSVGDSLLKVEDCKKEQSYWTVSASYALYEAEINGNNI